MTWFRRFRNVCNNLLRKPQVESELDLEIRAYAGQLADEKMARGATARQARREAAIETGGIEQIKEEVRQASAGYMLEQLLQDLRYGTRALRRNPAFTIAAILALALGIGANTAMYSVAYGVLWRPLPYANSSRVAVVYMRYFPRDYAWGTMCFRDFNLWRANNHAFENPSLFRSLRTDVGGQEGVPEQVQGATVTAGFFSTLGAPPLAGRTFVPGDDNPGARSLAVLSESIWRRRFGARPSVIGESIVVNGAPSTVIGVMRGDFRFPRRDTEIWSNLRLVPPTRYGPWFYRGVARLKPGVTLEQARTELDRVAQLMMQENPTYKRLSLPTLTLRDAILGPNLKPAIFALVGAVALVLLIAVVNVANLLLARAATRKREMALRLSIGAGRVRLVRQLLTESVLLSLTGGTAGLGLAWGAIAMIRAWNPGGLPLIDSVRLDSRAFAFMLLLAALTGVLFGLAPAFASARAGLSATLNEGGRGGAGETRARGRARSILVAAEIALSLMLLAGAGLLLRSFANLERVTGGFSTPPRQLLTMLISPSGNRYNGDAATRAYYEEAVRRASQIPGVEFAAVTDSLPPDRQGDADTFQIEGQTLAPGQINPIISDATVTPEFFRALGIPLLSGRLFTAHDLNDSLQVAIVSEGFARRFLPGQNPIGKRLKESGPGYGDRWMQVVGVVGSVKYLGLTFDTDAAYYMPLTQNSVGRMYLVARTPGDAANTAAAVREAVQAIDPEVTLAEVGTMDQALATSVSQPRFDAMLLVLFAAIALALAAVGVYGLIAYSVAQRTREIGVRMALGAGNAQVIMMIVGEAAMLAVCGIALGLAGALALTRFLATMLFGVGATDAATFAAASAALLAIALAAALVPAWRAARVSPVTALRYE